MGRNNGALAKTARRRRFVLKKTIEGCSRRQTVRAARRKFGEEQLPAGYDARYVAKDLRRMTKKVKEENVQMAEKYRDITIRRLETVLTEVMPLCQHRTVKRHDENGVAYTVEVPPSMAAVDRLLKLSDRLERLYGTDDLPPMERPTPEQGANYFFTQINREITHD